MRPNWKLEPSSERASWTFCSSSQLVCTSAANRSCLNIQIVRGVLYHPVIITGPAITQFFFVRQCCPQPSKYNLSWHRSNRSSESRWQLPLLACLLIFRCPVTFHTGVKFALQSLRFHRFYEWKANYRMLLLLRIKTQILNFTNSVRFLLNFPLLPFVRFCALLVLSRKFSDNQSVC